MKDIPDRTRQTISENRFLQLAIAVGITAALIAVGLYAYLGTFSRYGSDDYCLSAFFLQDNLLNAMVQRYFTASSRYTNILFIGLVDKFLGWYNVAILPALMLGLFVLGLYLFLKQITKMLNLHWSRAILLFVSILIVYFSVMQAPDLYETLYWRAGMTSHFAPVVFIPFLGTFLLAQFQKAKQRSPAVWVQAACFTIPFLIGGLSEPPTALMITALGLALVASWWWLKSDVRYRRSVLTLLLCALLGALTALIVMAVAPANSIRMQTPPPPLPELVTRIVSYPIYFILDTVQTLPLPTLISVAVPALLFYVQYAYLSERLSEQAGRRLGILVIVVVLLTYLLIAACFAPSAYGQSYPVARSRFIGRVLMTAALMLEGGLLGTLLAQIRIGFLQPTYFRNAAILALIFLALYPLRTAQRITEEIPVYRERAAAWDLREVEIRELKEDGLQDLVVPFLSTERSQDLGDRTGFRLNRCAAALYGVNSIIAVPMDESLK